jgi:hypothetical protein
VLALPALIPMLRTGLSVFPRLDDFSLIIPFTPQKEPRLLLSVTVSGLFLAHATNQMHLRK